MIPPWLDGEWFLSAADALGFSDLPIGTWVVAVVVSLGREVVGAAPACPAPEENPSSPTNPTHPSRATGARYRPLSSLRIPCPTYLRRKRQE